MTTPIDIVGGCRSREGKGQPHVSTSDGDVSVAMSLDTTPSTPYPLSDLSSPPSSLFSGPATPQTQSPLLRTPCEILHRVLCHSTADDIPTLARAAKTCRELRSLIYENSDQALWRDIHLQTYDDPKRAAALTVCREVDWKKRVQDREFVMRIFRDWDEDRYEELPQHLDFICSTLLDMYLDLPALMDEGYSPAKSIGSEDCRNGPHLEAILRSVTFQHMYYNLSTRETRKQLRPLPGQQGNPNRRVSREVVNPTLSRLHALLSPDFSTDDKLHRQHRGYLRETVYSSQNFNEMNDWGPFTPEGATNWDLVDAIGSVMMANARDVLAMGEVGWRQAVLPLSYGLDPVRGWGLSDVRRPPDLPEGEVWDWAGVKGPWSGSYAFLDNADWIALNEPRILLMHRANSQLDLSHYSEAIGDLMRLDLVVDKDSAASCIAYAPKGARNVEPLDEVTTVLPIGELLPPIYFHGRSQQQHGGITHLGQSPASFVRGVVQLTADDPPQVRWTLVIRYGGEDRWRLECVQPGGRGSTRGFFGIWTAADKEDHSPNGPVWYWRA